MNDHAGWMMVDTGCSGTAIDKGFHQRAGLKAAGCGQGFDATTGLGKIPLAAVSLIGVGPIRLKGLQCAVIDYGPLQRALKIKFIGILGAELFQNRLIMLDVGRGRLARVETVPQSFVRKIPIRRFVYGIPVVEVRAGRIKMSAVVDTGNANMPLLVYSRRIAEALRHKFQSQGGTKHWGVSGKRKTKATRVTCPVSFAGLYVPAATVACQDAGSDSIIEARVQGNIGLPLLRDRRIIFDYAHKLLHVEP